MITSTSDFVAWWERDESLERHQALQEPISPSVLAEIVQSFPECRAYIAWRRESPLEVLAVLREDEDWGVQWRVRTNRRWLVAHPDDARPWEDDPSELVNFRLTDEERQVLRLGLVEWGGPARCTTEMAVAMGFETLNNLFDEGSRIGEAILRGEPLSRTDWTRAMLATEIVFASNVMGSGRDWAITTGLGDETTLRHLRSLQGKVITAAGVVGVTLGTRPARP